MLLREFLFSQFSFLRFKTQVICYQLTVNRQLATFLNSSLLILYCSAALCSIALFAFNSSLLTPNFLRSLLYCSVALIPHSSLLILYCSATLCSIALLLCCSHSSLLIFFALCFIALFAFNSSLLTPNS